MDIPHLRLVNQKLTAQTFDAPEDVVSWFGAMQAQDFAAAKWALALRSKNPTDATIEQAFNKGKILRTHIMRPTWHFITPKDIRWLLALTSHRVHRFNGSYYRKSGLDKSIFEKSNKVLAKVLQGKQLIREELNVYLKEAHIPTEALGLTYIIMQAELEGIIVSGPRRDKQFTYMLLEDRVPQAKQISDEEALFELTKRYFQSHGPAQAKDFSWWSGLTLADVRKGIDLQGVKLQEVASDGNTYYFFETKTAQHKDTAFLVPGFDEYFIAYTDRHDVLDKKYVKELNQGGGMVNGAVVVNGKMVGGWRRTFEKKSVILNVTLFEKISAIQKQVIELQAKRFERFLALPLTLNI